MIHEDVRAGMVVLVSPALRTADLNGEFIGEACVCLERSGLVVPWDLGYMARWMVNNQGSYEELI